jgi:hypothetical protein
MNCQIFDHTLTLNMTAEMRDDIDRALILVQDTLVLTRSEFIRVACQYALDSLAADSGDVPVSVEERKARVLAGADELDEERSDPVPAEGYRDYPRPRCASTIDVQVS